MGDVVEQVKTSVVRARLTPAPTRSRVPLLYWAGGLAITIGAGAALATAWPSGDGGGAVDGAQGLEPRSAPEPGVSIFCPWTNLSACPIGGLLAFKAAGLSRPGYLLAYAEPVRGGDRIWYFSADTTAPAIAAGSEGTRTAPIWARIGDEHGPGPYRVQAFVACRPLPRSSLAALPDDCILERAQADVTMIRR